MILIYAVSGIIGVESSDEDRLGKGEESIVDHSVVEGVCLCFELYL